MTADNFELGLAHLASGAIREALEAFEACDPEDARAKTMSGAALARLGETARADAAYRKAIEMEPSEELFYVSYAGFLAEQKKSSDAEARGAEAVALAREDLSGGRLFEVAEALRQVGVWRAAAAAYGDVRKIGALTSSVAMIAAQTCVRAGEKEAALSFLDDVTAAGVHDRRVYQLGATLLAEMCDWPRLETVSKEWGAQHPDDMDALYHWSQALYELGRFPEAVDVYDKAVQLRGNDPDVLATHGRLCLDARRISQAQESFQKAQALKDGDENIEYGLARVATFQGRLEEAEGHCRRAIEFNPEFIQAYGELSNLKEGALSDEEITSLEALSKTNSASEANRAMIEFALGDARRKQKKHAAAFERYERANAILHLAAADSGSGYDHDLEVQQLEKVKSLFRGRSSSPQRAQSTGSLKPIFVVGMPRSGTTLIESLIAAHPRVFGAGEMLEIPLCLDEMLTGDGGRALDSSEQLARWRDKYFASNQLEEMGKEEYFVDKQPLNFKAVGLIKTMFPEASIVHIRRNPFDTCFSIYRRNFSKYWPFSNDLSDLGRFYGLYAQYIDFWERVYGGALLTIQYSDLMDDFEGNARRIVKFCDLEWDDKCLTPERSDRNVITFSSVQVRRPVTKDYTGQSDPYVEFLAPLAAALKAESVDLETGALLPV